MMRKVFGFALTIIALTIGPAFPATFYVAPVGAASTGTPDGSEALPFPSLDAAFASKQIADGDTILLLDGAHGDVTVNGQSFTTPVTIAAKNRRMAQLDSLLIRGGSRNLVFSGIDVVETGTTKTSGTLVRSYADTSDITIRDIRVRSNPDSRNFRQWTAAQWQARKFDGIFLQGPRSTVARNYLVAVNMGIMVEGADSLVQGNVVNGFNGDGLRGLGDNNVFRNNRVFNCVQTNGNHADGFQSFSSLNGKIGAGIVRGLVLDGNAFIEWTDGSNHPLRCALQGIGMFDGFFEDVTIVNNLVAVRAYHGIAIAGIRRGKIINNTVVNMVDQADRNPWIAIGPHKDGTQSTDVQVSNNLAMAYLGSSDPLKRVTYSNNSVIGVPGRVFLSPGALDYRPKAASGFINTADPAIAPTHDMLRQKRPAGGLPDLGAYETQTTASATSADDLLSGGVDTGGGTTGGLSGGKWLRLPGTPASSTTAPTGP